MTGAQWEETPQLAVDRLLGLMAGGGPVVLDAAQTIACPGGDVSTRWCSPITATALSIPMGTRCLSACRGGRLRPLVAVSIGHMRRRQVRLILCPDSRLAENSWI